MRYKEWDINIKDIKKIIEKEHWWYSIEERYYSSLGLTVNCKKVPKQYCACTIIDMGDVGEFKSSCVHSLVSYILEKGLEQIDVLYGIRVFPKGNESVPYKYLTN